MTDEAAAAAPYRVAVLWSRLSGYFSACLRGLSAAGAEIFVVHEAGELNAPFDPDMVSRGFRAEEWTGAPDEAAIDRWLDDFQPDAILVSSWNFGAYRRVCRRRAGTTLRIFGMDNQWHGTVKQRLGVASSRVLLRPAYDAVYLCDERQANFAERLGFPAERMIWGLYSGDYDAFAAVAQARGAAPLPQQFLYVGRLVPEKSIDVLAAGYAEYRSMVADPWPLAVAGAGPDEPVLTAIDGVKLHGFVQPDELPTVFADAGCLVLPSRFEPWAVVVHEAAAAGLPVICTRACGASTRLVLDGYNGVVVSPGNVSGLAQAFARIHRADDRTRAAMSRASESLAQQYSPRLWAERLLRRIPELRAQIGLPAPT